MLRFIAILLIVLQGLTSASSCLCAASSTVEVGLPVYGTTSTGHDCFCCRQTQEQPACCDSEAVPHEEPDTPCGCSLQAVSQQAFVVSSRSSLISLGLPRVTILSSAVDSNLSPFLTSRSWDGYAYVSSRSPNARQAWLSVWLD